MALFNLSKDIFRAYDIRGIVDETLTPEVIYWIARAIGQRLGDTFQKTIAVGRDGRLSAEVLGSALVQGLQDAGCHVKDIGAVPTPVLYFAAHALHFSSGVMLTGSHNPKDYNGLKMVIEGQTLAEEQIQQLYHHTMAIYQVSSGKYIPLENIYENQKGTYEKLDIASVYIRKIKKIITLKKKLTVVIDAGNGIAGKIAPQLYRALGCEVKEIFCEVDGHFPHHHPDPSVAENLIDLIQAVKTYQADIGLAFDGDGDRLGVVTDQGEIIWPDRQLMLYAKDALSRQPGGKIIFDVKCTAHLAKVIHASGGVAEMWKTGHSLLKRRMHEQQALLAGEMSGHIFFKEKWYGFDDGLYAGARLLEILSRDTRACSAVFKDFPDSINTPELKIAVNPAQRDKILQHLSLAPAFDKATLIKIDGIRAEFEKGFGLIRASNTTPHLTLRFEAEDKNYLDYIQSVFRQEILNLEPGLQLSF